MKKNNIDYFENKEGSYDRQGVFSQDCPTCEESNTILTQTDDAPEYYTGVHTYCKCGELLSWLLPVN